jgi:hypothetical protein
MFFPGFTSRLRLADRFSAPARKRVRRHLVAPHDSHANRESSVKSQNCRPPGEAGPVPIGVELFSKNKWIQDRCGAAPAGYAGGWPAATA